jgi:PTS system fructose-specific IIC component
MAAGVGSKAPHGGIFVFFAIDSFLWFCIAIAAGTVVGAFAVIGLKRWAVKKPVDTVETVPVAA